MKTKREYLPKFLSWCKSYEEEVKAMRDLIGITPSDIKQLKREYYELTGKRYRKRKKS